MALKKTGKIRPRVTVAPRNRAQRRALERVKRRGGVTVVKIDLER